MRGADGFQNPRPPSASTSALTSALTSAKSLRAKLKTRACPFPCTLPVRLKKNPVKIRRNFVLPVVMASSLALTSCSRGGSGSDSTMSSTATSTKAAGLYSGTGTATTPGVTLGAFQLLILENDEYWWMYGDSAPTRLVIDNFEQGQGESTATTFTSATGTDFAEPGSADPTITATYVPNGNISGITTSSFSRATFSADPVARTTYDYNAAANLAVIVGAWSLSALDGYAAAINIGANGVITGTSGGCTLTGNIAPRQSGKNVFNTSVTFGPATCSRAGQTFTGIGLSYPNEFTRTRQLIIAAVNSDRTASTGLYGTR